MYSIPILLLIVGMAMYLAYKSPTKAELKRLIKPSEVNFDTLFHSDVGRTSFRTAVSSSIITLLFFLLFLNNDYYDEDSIGVMVVVYAICFGAIDYAKIGRNRWCKSQLLIIPNTSRNIVKNVATSTSLGIVVYALLKVSSNYAHPIIPTFFLSIMTFRFIETFQTGKSLSILWYTEGEDAINNTWLMIPLYLTLIYWVIHLILIR